MPTPTPGTMGSILSDAGTISTTLFTVVSSVVNTIVGQPLLLIPVLFGLTVAGIGIFKRIKA